MCSFILQEAGEKISEIKVKTDHDFFLAKQLIVQNSRLKLQEDFKQKKKDYEIQKRIRKSVAIGEARVKKMVTREELVQEVKQEAVEKLAKMFSEDQAAYRELLKRLIIQGLIKLNESAVAVMCREADTSIVNKLLDECTETYKKMIKESCNEDIVCSVSIVENKFLPPNWGREDGRDEWTHCAGQHSGQPSLCGFPRLDAHDSRHALLCLGLASSQPAAAASLSTSISQMRRRRGPLAQCCFLLLLRLLLLSRRLPPPSRRVIALTLLLLLFLLLSPRSSSSPLLLSSEDDDSGVVLSQATWEAPLQQLEEQQELLVEEDVVETQPQQQQETLRERKTMQREARSFFVIKQQQQQRGGVAGELMQTALVQLGYRRAESAMDSALLWVIALDFPSCEDPSVASVINSLSDLSKVVVFCYGDLSPHASLRKDHLYSRLQWLGAKFLQSTLLENCPAVEEFVPQTYVVQPGADLRKLEEDLLVRAQKKRSYIVKLSLSHLVEGKSSSQVRFPIVTKNPLPGLKKLLKHRGFEGVVLQPYLENALLWKGRKFSIHPWAIVLQGSPNLVAFYHDGMTIRSLDETGSSANSLKSSRARATAALANITTHQYLHPRYNTETKSEVHGCLNEFQQYLNGNPGGPGTRRRTELQAYVQKLLKPYLKKIMIIVLLALRKESEKSGSSSTKLRTVQHICFNFMIDSGWNVWLLDVRIPSSHPGSPCSANPGDESFASDCKMNLKRALGVEVIKKMEDFLLENENSNWDDQGMLEVLIDQRLSKITSSTKQILQDMVCKNDDKASSYQEFRVRQTFSKRVVALSLPEDGMPQITKIKLHSDPWECPVCGYLNGDGASHCDQCGKASKVETRKTPEMEEESPRKETLPSRLHDELNLEKRHDTTDPQTLKCLGHQFRVQHDIDYQGGDIQVIRTSSLTACCAACANNRNVAQSSGIGSSSQCAGFTFVPQKFDCWLKNGVDITPGIQNEGVSSGFIITH